MSSQWFHGSPPGKSTSQKSSRFAATRLPAQEPLSSRRPPPTQEDLETQAFLQRKHEAFGLGLQAKNGSITPEGREQLGILRAKMDDFWAARLERSKGRPNLLEVLAKTGGDRQAEAPAMAGPSSKVVQRLVVYSGAKPPEDANVVATLPDTERSTGGPVVHESDAPDYSKAAAISMLAHGSQGSIEWKGGEWDGTKLVDDELLADSDRAIKTGARLELWSCSAGERSDEETNDSLVDAVKTELTDKSVNGVDVKGVKGAHIVLNDQGDHYVPDSSVDFDVFAETFLQLRAYYLWLNGFFSNELISALGGFEQRRVGIGSAWHPVLIPKDMVAANVLIGNLRKLYEAEVKCGGVAASVNYVDFLRLRMAAWQRMSSYLRTNSAFKSVTTKVEADWLNLTS